MAHASHLFPLSDPHRQFVVAQNARGKWVAREAHGMIEGVFHEQRDAVRFALYETGDPRSVVVISGGPGPRRAAFGAPGGRRAGGALGHGGPAAVSPAAPGRKLKKSQSFSN